jgi:hypothetical protein
MILLKDQSVLNYMLVTIKRGFFRQQERFYGIIVENKKTSFQLYHLYRLKSVIAFYLQTAFKLSFSSLC